MLHNKVNKARLCPMRSGRLRHTRDSCLTVVVSRKYSQAVVYN